MWLPVEGPTGKTSSEVEEEDGVAVAPSIVAEIGDKKSEPEIVRESPIVLGRLIPLIEGV